MEYVFILLCVIFLAFFLTHFFDSQSGFWIELRKNYPCDDGDYRKVKGIGKVKERFVYCIDENWTSDNYTQIRLDEGFLYLSVAAPFSLLVKPIKIHRNDFIYEGIERYWLTKRKVYSVAKTSRIKIALPFDLKVNEDEPY